ncbi:MAG: caffeoyl-CoA [Bacteroidetes bacterium]|nr:MAG: caffeoyl-CoA [Bacteroidota bacterium]
MSELFERPQYQTTAPEYERYAIDHTSPEPELMQRLIRDTNLAVTTPGMLSGLLQGRLLQMISFMLKPDLILEIGTFTGYSAIYLASGLTENGKLHTIDNNPEVAHIANKYFIETGLQHKIITHQGNAMDILPSLTGVFDLVFIDADKENYLNYYETVLPKVRQGGFILVDNVLWYGKVMNPDALSDKETRGIVEFNQHIKNDQRIEHLLLPVRDGLMMVRKR